jgi:riboflavin kinase/FMN adenylyltransferase
MMNIGFNLPYLEKLSIEIHFLDFDADLYDQKLTISVLKHLRPEQNLIPLIY